MTVKEFVSQYVNSHTDKNIKKFPDDFIKLSDPKKLELPPKTSVLGNEFFGQFEILSTEGTPLLQASDIFEAKYIVYANKQRKGTILIPKISAEIKKVVELYEEYLDSVLHDIEGSFLNEFPNSPELHKTTNEIFLKLGLSRL